MNLNTFYRFSYLFLFFLIIGFHTELIVQDTILMRDDAALVSAVDTTNSISDYFHKIWDGYYYDIQPVRDLTFYVNLKFYYAFGYGGFHLTNIFILLGILFLVRRNLLLLDFKEGSILLGMTLLACHPLMNASTAWVSNRKHLLSVFFILLYSQEELKQKTSELKSYLWALLSFLSQPITIFIPSLVLAYKWFFQKKRLTAIDCLLVLTTLLLIGLNYNLYHTNEKFSGRLAADALNSSLGYILVQAGRIPIQILFPISLSVEYDVGNVLNLVGIGLTVILIYLYVKLDFKVKDFFLYLIIATSLFPVLKWGVRDAYLILTLLLATYLVVKYIDRYRISNKTIAVFVVVATFFSVNSWKFTNMWLNEFTLYKTSYETEGGGDNLYKYAMIVSKRNPTEAYAIYTQIMRSYPDMVNPNLLARKAETLYTNPSLTDVEKLKTFKEIEELNAFDVFFEMKLLSKLGHKEQFDNAKKALLKSLEEPYNRSFFVYIMCEAYAHDCTDLGLNKK